MRGNVILTTGATRFELRPRFGAAPAGGERVDLHSPGQALAWLRQHRLGAAGMAQLRALLGDSHGRGLVHDDHEVLRRVADALHDGALQLYRRMPAVRAPMRAAVATARADAPPQRAAVSGPGRTPPPRRPSAPASEPAPVEADALDNVDQDAQAAVLETAARDGTPFCAVCEQMARERAAALGASA